MARMGKIRGIAGGILMAGLAALLLLPQEAQARIRLAGARVLVTAVNPYEEIKGELIGVRADAVVVEDESKAAREIAVERISEVRFLRRSGVLPMALAGVFVGGMAGLALAGGRDTSDDGPFEGALATVIYGGVGMAGGLVLGIVGGIATGTDKKYDLADMDPEAKSAFLNKLRKHARVRNYQ